ncbi:spermidine synthase [Pseudonocardia oroxyli]|uniref:S-adenosylmethionine decarboxylase proenzyme n=1 Tax=Pseudonocardia oroxyli TaxID=366584 RepID=A0A1G7E7C5_PSEOR|nr:spermidine synthase [Pseudonocardia oroxyli]
MRTSPPGPSGRHVLAELRGVDPALLDDAAGLVHALRTSLLGAGADVRQMAVEAFTPQGVTVVALLAESHASLHTWPEHGTALVDVFTCGDAADPELAVRTLARTLGATGLVSRVVSRGGTEVVEALSAGVTRTWAVEGVRARVRTAWQEVLIADTAQGVTLFCDDERQSAEHTQLTYHEALFVPAALLADRRERVLVVGSSEGVVSELAVACGARTVDHVDLDEECVRLCAEHLPYGYSPAELAAAERGSGPVRMHFADGLAFVAEATEQWDVIVVDLPDERPDDPSAQLNRLYSEDFLTDCAGRLRPGGVVVAQAGSPAVWRDGTLRAAWARFSSVFAQTVYAGCPEHEWAFLCGLMRPIVDPGGMAARRLAELPYTPATLDADDLRARTVAPSPLRSHRSSSTAF